MVGAEARLSLVIAYRRYRNRFLLGIAAIGTLCVFVAYHLCLSEMLVYAGLAALVGGEYLARVREPPMLRLRGSTAPSTIGRSDSSAGSPHLAGPLVRVPILSRR